jgi:hypothetical protein
MNPPVMAHSWRKIVCAVMRVRPRKNVWRKQALHTFFLKAHSWRTAHFMEHWKAPTPFARPLTEFHFVEKHHIRNQWLRSGIRHWRVQQTR